MMDLLDELNSAGKTMIISTHDVDRAYSWADDIILMESGGVLRTGAGPEIFADVELINMARLKLPIVVDLYRVLVERGLIKGSRPPRNVLELTSLIEFKSGGAVPKVKGKIYLCNADVMEEPQVLEILGKFQPDYRGAMGINAKIMAEHAGIPLDFTYGVIDKSILKALIGKSTLIMISGGMVDHSVRRIQEYSEESGAKIEVIKLSPPEKSSAAAETSET
jgi:cobalt/nickel transport system ATP-binding protein